MRLYPSAATCCVSDVSFETTMQVQRRGRPGVDSSVRRAKQVFHRSGDWIFWHWSDREVVMPEACWLHYATELVI